MMVIQAKLYMQPFIDASYTPPQDHPQSASGVKYHNVSIAYTPHAMHQLARAQPHKRQQQKQTFFFK